MVFFTCNGCGESLKKNKVFNHTAFCKYYEYVTCIDCNNDFWGSEFKMHTRCITEDEKYGGTGYQKKMTKGDVKQQEWLKKIQDASMNGGLSNKAKELLESLLDYDNIPRKQAKFKNFLKNSLRIYNANLADEVWKVFSAPPKKENGTAQETSSDKKNASTKSQSNVERVEDVKTTKKEKNGKDSKSSAGEDTKKSKKSKKRKAAAAAEELTEMAETKKNKKAKLDETICNELDEKQIGVAAFPWKKTFHICVKSAGGEIALKKLKKQVLTEYKNYQGDQEFRSDIELEKLFTKKLNTTKKIKLEKGRVVLSKGS